MSKHSETTTRWLRHAPDGAWLPLLDAFRTVNWRAFEQEFQFSGMTELCSA